MGIMVTEKADADAQSGGRSPRRPIVPSAEAKVRLIDTAIDLLRELPFDEVTARKVTDAVGLALPTISRNFGSMEGLFASVSNELLERAFRRTSVIQDLGVFFDPDLVLRTRLLAWLIAEGSDPAVFRTTFVDDVTDQFRKESGGVSDRTARAWLHTVTFLLEGFAVFSEVRELSEQEFLDGFELLRVLRTKLLSAETELGWAE
jgi:AcrR family transcriptional regulator